MKRTAVAALWAFAFWYLGAFIAAIAGISPLAGPIMGIAAGALVGIDPRGLFWAKADHPNPRIATRLATMGSPEGSR